MQSIGRLLSGLFLVLVFVASIVFSYFNATPVAIRFGNLELAPQPVAVWIIGAFAIGGTIGLLFGLRMFKSIKAQVEIRRLKKSLSDAREEASQLRVSSFKESD